MTAAILLTCTPISKGRYLSPINNKFWITAQNSLCNGYKTSERLFLRFIKTT